MAALGFNHAAFAPTSNASLALLFPQDPDLLTGGDLILPAAAYFKRLLLSELILDSVIVLLQDIITLAPLPGGISGKAIPSVFYQLRALTLQARTFTRVANLHGTHASFPTACTLFPIGTDPPISITAPCSLDTYVYALTSHGVDYLQSLPGGYFDPLWLTTSGANPPHPIQFISEFPIQITAASAHSATSTPGLVSLANANPLYPVNSQVLNKANAGQKNQFENISTWFWFNGQDMNLTLDLFGGK